MWSLPKMVICTSKKAQNCKKVALKKIFTDAQKDTQEKVIILENL